MKPINIIFAVGAILVFMLTLYPPFNAVLGADQHQLVPAGHHWIFTERSESGRVLEGKIIGIAWGPLLALYAGIVTVCGLAHFALRTDQQRLI